MLNESPPYTHLRLVYRSNINVKNYEHIHYLRDYFRDSSCPGTCLFQDCGQV